MKPIARITILLHLALHAAGCSGAQVNATATPIPGITALSRDATPTPMEIPPTPFVFIPGDFAFPESPDPAGHYLFYLHGKIIEDQGLPAISPEFGEYKYPAILQSLGSHGFTVVSEVRSKDTNNTEYAEKVTAQVTALLEAGVLAENITIVGASKGAGIAILVSYLLENPRINYVLLAICEPDLVSDLVRSQVLLHGNVRSIYDTADKYAGSCRDLFAASEGQGLSRYDEIVLEVGSGHGILYRPLDAWVLPTVDWALGGGTK